MPSLFSSHLKLAHHYWSLLLQRGDWVCDATCGNGHDTLFLAQQVISPEGDRGRVFGIDIQKEALEKTEERLKKYLPTTQQRCVTLQHQCHSSFPTYWKKKHFALFVYNLGYLPGGDKTKITDQQTTLCSIQQAQHFLRPGGAISITCYPRHPGGAEEEQMLVTWAENLSPHSWHCSYHQWKNRKKAPSLLFLQKKPLLY